VNKAETEALIQSRLCTTMARIDASMASGNDLEAQLILSLMFRAGVDCGLEIAKREIAEMGKA
jgi:hypothetical protein